MNIAEKGAHQPHRIEYQRVETKLKNQQNQYITFILARQRAAFGVAQSTRMGEVQRQEEIGSMAQRYGIGFS